MTLPRIVRSGITPSRSCAPPRATRKPEITSSKTSRAPAASRLAQKLEEARLRRDHAHVRRVGLAQERSDLALGERALNRLAVVPGHNECVGGLRGGHARARRNALGREPRAGVGEQPVDVTVVGAGELHDPVPARRGARETHGAHRRLGARRGHAHHLRGRDARADLLRELDLCLGRRAEARAGCGGGRTAETTSGCAWPAISGPHDITQST